MRRGSPVHQRLEGLARIKQWPNEKPDFKRQKEKE
jgi:hypothetical protein